MPLSIFSHYYCHIVAESVSMTTPDLIMTQVDLDSFEFQHLSSITEVYTNIIHSCQKINISHLGSTGLSIFSYQYLLAQ